MKIIRRSKIAASKGSSTSSNNINRQREYEYRRNLYLKRKHEFETLDEEGNNDVLSREDKMNIAKAEMDKVAPKSVNSAEEYDVSEWRELASKSVLDSDGFYTDYTLYTNGSTFICMFGDKDIYEPDEMYADYETENEADAYSWFDNYEGFSDEEDEFDEFDEFDQVFGAASEDGDSDALLSDIVSQLNDLPVRYGISNVSYNDIQPYESLLMKLPVGTVLMHRIDAGPEKYTKIKGGEFGWWSTYRAPWKDTVTKSEFDVATWFAGRGVISRSDIMLINSDTENNLTNIDASWDDYEDDIQEIDQEFTSENTSINSGKLPAIFKMINLEPGTINIDYGGGRFDNVAEYLTQYDVVNLVYDPYNRSKEHNQEVIRTVKAAGGADTATCSNVLNVIKEPEVRQNVLQNIRKLVKPNGSVYITVYEGSGKGNEGPTKSGYQLNRRTADYLEEVKQVFPDAVRKGKLIVATNSATISVNSSTDASSSASYGGAFDIEDDQHFTKDEIVEFGNTVCDHLNETFYDTYYVSDVYMENPKKLVLTVVQASDKSEFTATVDIDMRKIKKPSDLMNRYLGDVVYALQHDIGIYNDESSGMNI